MRLTHAFLVILQYPYVPNESIIMLTHEFNFLPRISGATGVEILAGLHWYLKYWCDSHISWDKTGGVQLQLLPQSGTFPRVQDAGIVSRRPVPWNYYQNAVTSSCKI